MNQKDITPPIFLVNLKNYQKGLGASGIQILKAMENVAGAFPEITFIASPSPLFLRSMIKEAEKVHIFAQHVDPVPLGSFTGHVPPAAVASLEADGTLINHSELRMDMKKIKKAIEFCGEMNLTVCACAPDPETAGKIATLKPLFLAYEPPALIGTDTSVSEAKPGLLSKSVRTIQAQGDGEVHPLCGAGIKGPRDVEKGMELGAKGILIASGIVKAKEPYEKLKELAQPMT